MNVDDVFALLDQPRQRRGPRVRVVPSEYGACPRCGAYWGHPNPALDFPNRSKVCDEDGTWNWRCYNPDCTCGYYDPERNVVTEDAPTPEEAAASAARVKAHVESMMVGKKWVTVQLAPGVTESRLVPVEDGDA